ncbi:MAG: hypothetical protein SOW18_00990 [Peptoniphilus sp.]|nr:hypothetical protein [Peptoniphilus sp.]MDY3118095.1 hypothetical protein [Peptoniphilus sp.]
MEHLIRSVIELDERTDAMVQTREKAIDDEKADLQKYFTEMEVNERDASKTSAKESYDTIYNEAMEVIEEIKENNRKKLETVDAVYKAHKSELVEKAFQLLDI